MELSEEDVSRGRDAEAPSAIPARGWKDVGWRVWKSLAEDRVMLIAGGVTFYLLTLFPALVAFMSIYGIFLDPATAVDQAKSLRGLIPPAAVDMKSSAAWPTDFETKRHADAGADLVSDHRVLERERWRQGDDRRIELCL